MTREEFSYLSADGFHYIHAVLFLPAGEPRGVVQLTHGICEYILRYEPFARFLTDQGYAVAGNDHLGHGGSVSGPEELGYFDRWDHLIADVFTLRQDMGQRFSGLPYFLLGHSMGSFVARTYLIDHPGTLTGCLLSGTGYQDPITVAFGRAVTRLSPQKKPNRLFYRLSLGAYNRAFAPNRTAVDWLSRDESVVDAYLADPLCSFPTTAAMDHAMLTGLGRIVDKAELAKMDKTTPIYLFAGEDDPVGDMGKGVRKVRQLLRVAGCREVDMKLYPAGRHEMLGELNKEEVWADVLAWMEAHR